MMGKILVLLALASSLIGTYGQDFTSHDAYLTVENRAPREMMEYARLPQDPAYYTDLCKKCTSLSLLIRIPKTCNLYLNCNSLEKHIMSCNANAFDDKHMTCVGANIANCGEKNPCRSNFNVTDGKTCGGYFFCDQTIYLQHGECPQGQGFDIDRGTCVEDSSCRNAALLKMKRVRAECRPMDGNRARYYMTETLEHPETGEQRTVPERDYPCPGQQVYHVDCKCKTEVEKCEDIRIVDLSSKDNTWSKALNWNRGLTYSKITGNATIETERQGFQGAAFFNGKTTYQVLKMINNSPGYYFVLSFDFQSMRQTTGDSYSPGVSQVNGGDANPAIALVDNSACGIKPTYGCQLRADTSEVRCYVNATRINGESSYYEESVKVDPSRRVSVKLMRTNNKGRMEITVNGRQPEVREWTFNNDDSIAGTPCAGTIGAGTDQRYLVGYIDNLYLDKQCQPEPKPVMR